MYIYTTSDTRKLMSKCNFIICAYYMYFILCGIMCQQIRHENASTHNSLSLYKHSYKVL